MPQIRAFGQAVTIAALASLVGCSDPTNTTANKPLPLRQNLASATAAAPTVTSTVPSQGARSTTLDVNVNGTGFDNGSTATFPLNGVVDPRVRVNRTRFVSSTQLVANVTIAADAPTVKYDVAVMAASGKKGIGTEMFSVVLKAEALVAGDVAYTVNIYGGAVGRATVASSCASSYLPILWRADGTRVVLPTGTHCAGTAWKINSSGAVSGQLFVPAGTALWTPQADGSYTLQDLGPTPAGTLARNTGAFNDAGEILGWYNGAKLYWRTSATPWTLMSVPSGATDCAVARAINGRGEIVGRCTVNGVLSPYYWKNHSAIPVALPRPATTSMIFPAEINDAGVIAGYELAGSYQAMRWVPSASTYPSFEYLPDAGLGSEAYGIAPDGTIAGSIETPTGTRPAIWPASGGYQLLGFLGSAAYGAAFGVTVTSGGLVPVGYQDSQALRWKAGP